MEAVGHGLGMTSAFVVHKVAAQSLLVKMLLWVLPRSEDVP